MTNLGIKNNLINFKQALNLMLNSDFLINDKDIKGNANFKVFDLYHTLMSLKELIRSLDEVKRNKDNKIYIYVENRYLRSISNLILNEIEHLKSSVSIISSPREIVKHSTQFNIFIVLGKVNKKFILETLMNKLFIVHVINDLNNQPVSGIYNMTNKISNVNKVIFLFALIDQVLKNDNNLTSKI
jgi:hypothetical protein